ncbi:MAG: TadE/TadG family type IV pilus assembly protein [Candidatus Limnocylindrales bacterium]
MRRAARRNRLGQSLAEFALVMPVLMLLFMALFDLGRAAFWYNSLANAAREGARLAIVNQDSASIIAHAQSESAMVELNTPSVDVNFYQVAADGTPDTSSTCSPVAVGCMAVVSFQATFRPITPIISNILFSGGVTMSSTSTLMVEYTCPSATVTVAQCPKQP